MIEEAFGDLEPTTAQYKMAVEDYADLLGKLKPAFIHHPESKHHIQWMFEEFGVDFRLAHLDDVVKKRGAASVDAACSGTVCATSSAGPISVPAAGGIALYDDGTETEGGLVYRPDVAVERARSVA